MSDILDVIKTRRSVRKYKSDMVPAEIIDKIIEVNRLIERFIREVDRKGVSG